MAVKKKVRRIGVRVLLAMLVVGCIGGAELAACYWLDPPIFQKITAPVVRAADAVLQKGSTLLGGVRTEIQAWQAARAERAEEAKQTQVESQKSASPSIPDGGTAVTDPSVTELVVRDGREILTGGSTPIVYFAQSDAQWRDQKYGSDSIGDYGCGPTAMAMAVSSLSGNLSDPASMARWCAENGYYAAGSGSYHTIVRGVAAGFGLVCDPPDRLTVEELRTQLSGGRIAVALMGPGHFTSTGHFILLRGVTLEGDILVADPNSRARSLQQWDAQMIIDECSNSREAGAPVWFLSAGSTQP